MKPIIIEMKDMSDSKEVYESRPNPILAGFIYLMLAMVITAVIWMYYSKIDIVVKGTGTVATTEDVATITNQKAGVIVEKYVEDGQEVKAGEILYVVSHEEQNLQLATFQQQLTEYTEKEEMYKAYQAWLEAGEEFDAKFTNNLFYSDVFTRRRLIELGQESVQQAYTGELAAYDAKLDANDKMITYYKEAAIKSRQLIEAIKTRENCFNGEEGYYRNTIENYLAQYQQIIDQYNEQIYPLLDQKDDASKKINLLEEQKAEIVKQKEKQEETEVSVSDEENKDNTFPDYEAEIQEIDIAITAQKSIQSSADREISQYNLQMVAALNTYERENVAAIENNIMGYEQSLMAYEGTHQEYVKGKDILKKQGTEVEISNLLTQEKNNIVGEIEVCRQSIQQLQAQIESLEQSISNATVTATLTGIVNMNMDVVEGDYLGVGTQVLSIIPESKEGAFVVKSYIENKDIAKIHEGMEVTYEIGAYPAREYGTLQGIVTFVSADLKVNNSGSAYYMVETSVNAEELRNSVGEVAKLKVGMLCETKIVVEEKSTLELLVEKLFHIVG